MAWSRVYDWGCAVGVIDVKSKVFERYCGPDCVFRGSCHSVALDQAPEAVPGLGYTVGSAVQSLLYERHN